MKLYEKITDKLIANSIITCEDKEIYVYGFEQSFLMLLNIMTTIVVGLIFNVLWQSIVFLLAYIPLRSYAGGYHARTQLRCYLLSIAIMVTFALMIKYISWNELSIMLLTLISCGVILMLAPIADNNKPLDSEEIKVYRNRTRIILLFEVFIICVFVNLGIREVSAYIMLSVLLLSIMLLLGNKKAKITQ